MRPPRPTPARISPDLTERKYQHSKHTSSSSHYDLKETTKENYSNEPRPPEINSGNIYAGPGPGSMLAAFQTW
ncbi:PPE domain-containing protein [Mycobacterium haemophilum]|uniref:PPE domain-containing protein n=1 Tax=Mycobacterium haemophilum TaxID=29311 RepID=UPI0039C92C09